MKMNFTFRDKPIFFRPFMSLTGLIFLILVFTSSCGKKEEPPAPQVIRPVKIIMVVPVYQQPGCSRQIFYEFRIACDG
jgi:hypothetical protein